MKLSCIGCGPGDPDLLTVKAVDRIRDADAIFYKPNISNDKRQRLPQVTMES